MSDDKHLPLRHCFGTHERVRIEQLLTVGWKELNTTLAGERAFKRGNYLLSVDANTRQMIRASEHASDYEGIVFMSAAYAMAPLTESSDQ
ncbi:Uncharacterised protein [uncultured archaeon]|nr:Uncharacterised protein [uncultured archaeon]